MKMSCHFITSKQISNQIKLLSAATHADLSFVVPGDQEVVSFVLISKLAKTNGKQLTFLVISTVIIMSKHYVTSSHIYSTILHKFTLF